MAAINCRDWRTCDAATVAGLLDREAGAWRDELTWNVRGSWRAIEHARSAGTLPGFVATDRSGAIVGWTWFLRHRDSLQVGALVASSAGVVRVLVAAILASAENRAASQQVWCVRGTPPGLAALLEEEGLATGEYVYLSSTLTPAPNLLPEHLSALRSLDPTDLPAVVELCRRAYRDYEGPRAFAPAGTGAEWRDYLAGLVGTDGCGTWLPDASFVADDADGGLAGAILVSAIDTDVAHVSQIVVSASAQGRGLGRRLLDAAGLACRERGFRLMTLLVSVDNHAALALYARAGFSGMRRFLVASSQPRRLTSVALATGGVSTRR